MLHSTAAVTSHATNIDRDDRDRRQVEQAGDEGDADEEAGFEREARPEATEHALAPGVGLPVVVRTCLLGVGSGGRRDGGSGRRSFLGVRRGASSLGRSGVGDGRSRHGGGGAAIA